MAGLAAAADDSIGNIAVFCGWNKTEGTLREACDTGKYTTVIISFLNSFGHGKYALNLSGHPLDGVDDDIKHFKSKGILVLLSIGGSATAGGGDYSLPSSQAAADLADYLWHGFLGGASGSGRQEDEDAVSLAVLDVVADAGEPVAGDVELVVAMAEGAEEGDDDGGVLAGVASLAQGALVLVPAPVDADVAGGRPGCQLQGKNQCKEQGACLTALERHRGEIHGWVI
ncbi:hypothetical protein EJB05_26937, partial [Eragrostis curvula]